MEEEMYFKQDSIINRVGTGIDKLDGIIDGGLPRKSITLVSGPPGSGKSIFCFQFLYEGVKKGDKCLFFTLDKKVNSIIIQAKKLGFDFQPAMEKKLAKFLFLNVNKKLVYESISRTLL